MANINKLVIYQSAEALQEHAANYAGQVTFNPFNNTGVCDDGCGHTASLTFAVVASNAAISALLGQRDMPKIGKPHLFNCELAIRESSAPPVLEPAIDGGMLTGNVEHMAVSFTGVRQD